MKPVTMYKDEVSGKMFQTEAEALESEKRNKGIQDIFAFVDMSDDCAYPIQRTNEYWVRFRMAIAKAIKEYEPSIAEQLTRHGHELIRTIVPGGIVGRWLGDTNSPVKSYYYKWMNICDICYREWDQPYNANHCQHTVSEGEAQ
jgi:hypothetical protein